MSRLSRSPYTQGMVFWSQRRVGRLAFSKRGPLLAAVAVALLPLSPLRADTFRLASGGQVQGDWLNSEEMPLIRFVIRQPSGVVLKLTR